MSSYFAKYKYLELLATKITLGYSTNHIIGAGRLFVINLLNFFFPQKWAIPGIFLFIFVFSIQLIVNNFSIKILPMTGFKPWTSGIGSDRSTNWVTTTSQLTKPLFQDGQSTAFKCLFLAIYVSNASHRSWRQECWRLDVHQGIGIRFGQVLGALNHDEYVLHFWLKALRCDFYIYLDVCVI